MDEDQDQASEPNETVDADESSAFLASTEQHNDQSRHYDESLKQDSESLKQDSESLKPDSESFNQDSKTPKQHSESLKQDLESLKTGDFRKVEDSDSLENVDLHKIGYLHKDVQEEDCFQEKNDFEKQESDIEPLEPVFGPGADTNVNDKDCKDELHSLSDKLLETIDDNGFVQPLKDEIDQDYVDTSNKIHNDKTPYFVKSRGDDKRPVNSETSNKRHNNIQPYFVQSGDEDRHSINKEGSSRKQDSDVNKGDNVDDAEDTGRIEDSYRDTAASKVAEMCNETVNRILKLDGNGMKDDNFKNTGVKQIAEGINETGTDSLSEGNTTDQGDLHGENCSQTHS